MPFTLNFLVNDGEQKVYDERAPDLYFDGICIDSKQKTLVESFV